MGDVWDHRCLGGHDYEIRCDGKPRVLVSIHSTNEHVPQLVRAIVETCARHHGGTVARGSQPPRQTPARRLPGRDEYEASDQFERDATAWWRRLSATQRHVWARSIATRPEQRGKPVHLVAYALHGGPEFRKAMARWIEGHAA